MPVKGLDVCLCVCLSALASAREHATQIQLIRKGSAGAEATIIGSVCYKMPSYCSLTRPVSFSKHAVK